MQGPSKAERLFCDNPAAVAGNPSLESTAPPLFLQPCGVQTAPTCGGESQGGGSPSRHPDPGPSLQISPPFVSFCPHLQKWWERSTIGEPVGPVSSEGPYTPAPSPLARFFAALSLPLPLFHTPLRWFHLSPTKIKHTLPSREGLPTLRARFPPLKLHSFISGWTQSLSC